MSNKEQTVVEMALYAHLSTQNSGYRHAYLIKNWSSVNQLAVTGLLLLLLALHGGKNNVGE